MGTGRTVVDAALARRRGGQVLLDVIGDACRGLVLPRPNHRPARCAKGVVDAFVASPIASQLRVPVAAIRPRSSAVLGTAMPEAAVDEHGEAGAGKHDVWAHAYRASVDRQVDSVSEAAPMEYGSEEEFRFRVAAAIAAHDCGGCSAARVRVVTLAHC